MICTHDEARRIGSAFCPACGAAMTLGAQSVFPTPPPPDGRTGSGAGGGAANLAMWAHLGGLIVWVIGAVGTVGVLSLFAWVPGLVVLNTAEAQRNPWVRRHATESMNFALSQLLYLAVAVVAGFVFAVVTFGLGLLVLIPVFVVWAIAYVVLGITATVKANRGEEYRYPLTIRWAR
ncbi:hypothetical protein BH09ACT11_BH09ACT11_19290 [soil metagenome]